MAPRGVWGKQLKLCVLAAIGMTTMATAPLAADWPPSLTAEISIEIEGEYVYRADDPEAERNDTFATAEVELELTSGPVGLHGLLTLEPVLDPVADRFFEDFGLFFEELYLTLDIGGAQLRAGKFNPAFDLANDETPGIYGDDLAGDYELSERIGVGFDYPFQALGGMHVVTAAAFMADRTVLSDSWFTSRGELRREDGGVSNTGSPESVAVSLAGEIGGTGYNIGLLRQIAGREDVVNEYGGVLGALRDFDLGPVETTLFGEIGYFPDFDGARERAAFYTFGAEASLGDFSLAAVYGQRNIGGLPADRVATFSLAYELREGLSIAAGYRYLLEEEQSSNSLGFLLTYDLMLP